MEPFALRGVELGELHWRTARCRYLPQGSVATEHNAIVKCPCAAAGVVCFRHDLVDNPVGQRYAPDASAIADDRNRAAIRREETITNRRPCRDLCGLELIKTSNEKAANA